MNWNERYASSCPRLGGRPYAGNDYEHARINGATHEEAMEAYGNGIPLRIYGNLRGMGSTHNEILEAHNAGIDLRDQYGFARHQLKVPHADIVDAKKQGVSDIGDYANNRCTFRPSDERSSENATHQQAVDVCKQGISSHDYYYERDHGADHETAVKNILSESSH
jgi:hypothetical protein